MYVVSSDGSRLNVRGYERDKTGSSGNGLLQSMQLQE